MGKNSKSIIKKHPDSSLESGSFKTLSKNMELTAFYSEATVPGLIRENASGFLKIPVSPIWHFPKYWEKMPDNY